ncbi:MAG: hypothetical protein AB7Q42_06580 [Acidimicrobiia bacterium]
MQPGRWIVQADVVGTAVFTASAVAGLSTDAWEAGSIVVSLALFGLGIFAFIWSYFSAVERSRTDEIGVANLFLLTGRTAPAPVRRVMSAALALQVLVAVSAAAAGFSGLQPDELNPMAFGILVPMFGMGLNGLWASRHGSFGPRIVKTPSRPPEDVPPPDHQMEQNAPHG